MSTTLSRGDIAFTAIRTDDPDSFSFVTFVDIAAGTKIVFTDNGWQENGTLRSGEGSVEWTAAAAVAAGAVVTLGGSGSFALSTSGDQIIAYQGAVGTPERLLAAVSTNAFITASGVALTSNQSYVPGTGTATTDDDLTPGLYSVQLSATATEVDNGAYQGQTTGTVEELREVINTAGNWVTGNDPAGLPAPPAAFTIDEGGSGETVSINDVSIAEGDTGTTLLTFTVTRSGNTGAFTLDFATADGTATTADDDYEANSGTLTFISGGDLSQTISVIINGDTGTEPNETLTVTLSNLVGSAGTTTIADAAGTGTITNDELVFTEIAAIQGAGHRSPLVTTLTGSPTGTNNVAQSGNSGSNRYNVEGVVTAIATNGFYIQDATPDADAATSDGIFVFTSSAPAATITVGETVRILNTQVSEFRGATNNLSVTQLSATVSGASIVELGGNTAIAPVVIGGPGGLVPPAGSVDDDGFTSYDPATDNLDFWESLEGMLVEIANPVAISLTSDFRTRDPADPSNAAGPPNQEIWVLAEGTYDPAILTPRGVPLLTETDTNPERIQIDDLTPGVDLPPVAPGAVLESVTGVVNYDFQSYEILTTGVTVITPSALAEETTTIGRDFRQLTIAAYNVENLDPVVEDTAAGSVAGNDLYTRLGNSDDDVGSGKYAAHARHIAQNLGAPTIVALQEVQDSDGATISSIVDATATLQLLVDLIEDLHGITYAFAFENPPSSNQDGGQPNANIRPAFLYRPDIVTLVDTQRITDPDTTEADGFAGDDFAASRKPLEGTFLFNGQTIIVINNHFNSKGGDNAIAGNVQPPVLTSEAQRVEQAKIVNARVDELLAADPGAKVIVAGDLNDFAWSLPNRTLDGSAGGSQVLTDLAVALLPTGERTSYIFNGNAQALVHMLVSDTLLDEAAPVFDIVRLNADLATGVSDHDPALARFDFRAFAEHLVLTAGRDSVDGGGGADTLDGGGGIDTLAGGAGDDLFILADRRARLIENAGEGADSVIASVSYRLDAFIESGSLAGGDALDLFGNALDNHLAGNGGANLLLGGLGGDTLDAGGGHDRAIGQEGDDLLLGGAGDDLLNGAEGADTLAGGEGADTLIGGAGADVFLFAAIPAAGEADRVLGFSYGTDRIAILGAGFDPLLAAGALDASRFAVNILGQSRDPSQGVFVFEADTRQLWWDLDGLGAGRTLVAEFTGPPRMTAADIIVI